MAYACIVKEGNLLLEEDATFIVNASNTRMMLGTGVSMAFREHCGNVLQEEMSEVYEALEKPVAQSTVVATSAGEAKNFKYALHAAVMNYNPGTRYAEKAPTLDVINNILENIEGYLHWYDEKTSKPIKLVLPLMGCGVGGLEKRAVIACYKDFFEREVKFRCKIVVYGHTHEDFKLIESLCPYSSVAHNSWSNYYDFVNEESFGSFVNKLTEETIKKVKGLLPDTNRCIIDFGAGTGRLSIPLAREGYQVRAVEPSQGMIDMLQLKSQGLDIKLETAAATLQSYTGTKHYDLGMALFTVLSYLTTEEALDTAILVMREVICDGGYMLLDVASEELFYSSHTQTPNMDRAIQIEATGANSYAYEEVCSGIYEGKAFEYKDSFDLHYWSEEIIAQKMKDAGFDLLEELDVFSFSGASYLLFKKAITP